MIDERAFIGKNVTLGENVVIEKDAIIGDFVTIGHHSVIKKDTVIDDYVTVGNMTSLGKSPSGNKQMNQVKNKISDLPPLVIGNGVKIGDNCVIYRGSILHDSIFIGDLASVREHVEIGKQSVVGRNAIIENNTLIGNNVTIQTGCYITAFMEIEDDVFIGPCCSTSNDKYMRSGGVGLRGPLIKFGAKIGNNATLLPNVTIGRESTIGAGTVVVHDVPDHKTVIGVAGKELEK
ncbi:MULTISPECIES: acyltransferase [Paraliobacillus]|uniref:acyltransferase n=1 Tax=Paraliobacillus TaxID=200903 RepID=UPI000DD3D506|nr:MULTISPECIES: N-acetyltransferase [Paraliobacillus]